MMRAKYTCWMPTAHVSFLAAHVVMARLGRRAKKT